jgi:hypothetical protein
MAEANSHNFQLLVDFQGVDKNLPELLHLRRQSIHGIGTSRENNCIIVLEVFNLGDIISEDPECTPFFSRIIEDSWEDSLNVDFWFKFILIECGSAEVDDSYFFFLLVYFLISSIFD